MPLMSIDVCELAIAGEDVLKISLWKKWIPLKKPSIEQACKYLLALRKEMNEVMVSREKSGKGKLYVLWNELKVFQAVK